MTLAGPTVGARGVTVDLHARVERHFTPAPGNGQRGSVVMHEVPHGELPRRADVIALNFYSGRPPVVGVEIKATRPDWLNELADQSKAEAWSAVTAEWWIAAAPGVVEPGELPHGWGLLEPTARTRMRVAVPARLRERVTVPTWLLIEAAKKIDNARVAEVTRAVAAYKERAERVEARQMHLTLDEREAGREAKRDAEDAGTLRALLAAAGITRRPFGLLNDPPNSPEGRALLAAVDGLTRLNHARDDAERKLRALRTQLLDGAEALDRALETVERINPRR